MRWRCRLRLHPWEYLYAHDSKPGAYWHSPEIRHCPLCDEWNTFRCSGESGGWYHTAPPPPDMQFVGKADAQRQHNYYINWAK